MQPLDRSDRRWTLPPAFSLVAKCSCRPLTPAGSEQIRALALGVDWEGVLRVVRRQRVAGLVHGALSAAGVSPPPPVGAELEAMVQAIARQNLRSVAEARRLQARFDEAGVPVAFLKGLCLGRLAYGSLQVKHARDIDILVPPALAESAWAILEGEGYGLAGKGRRSLGPQRRGAVVRYLGEVEMACRSRTVLLDLHWRLAENPALLRGDVWASAKTVDLGGGARLRTLGDEDHFAYLCVHGAHHAWMRLKWLADLHAFVGRDGAPDLLQLHAYARARGAGLCAGQALLLCRHLLGLQLPAELEAELKADRRIRLLTRIALEAMVGRDGATELPDRPFGGALAYIIYLSQWLLGRSAAFYGAQLWAFSLVPADVIACPLPWWAQGLYPLLRLPLWLGRVGKRFLQRARPGPAPGPRDPFGKATTR